MKTASSGLIQLLKNNDTFFIADLYTFTLIDGSVYRYTDTDVNITYSGNVFDSASLILKRSSINTSIGLDVDSISIEIYPRDNDIMASKPFLQALAQGNIDGAQVLLERAIMTTFGDVSNGVITMFLGRVSEIGFSRTIATITVKSMVELLNINMPRNIYSLGCIHTVYDSGCTLLKSSFATSAIIASATNSVLNFTDSHVDGYFDQGMIEFTSGANTGLKRTVKTHTSGTVSLSLYLPNVPMVGDTFMLYAGCDRAQSTCSSKFSNLAHFRGYPYIPAPEAIT